MNQHPIRVKLLADAVAVLKTLPAMGKLMINSKNGGATHERIGIVEKVDIHDGWISFSGAEHHARINMAAIATLIADRSSIMQEKVYPRIDLLAGDDSVIGSVIGFDDAEPFDKALENFDFIALAPKQKEERAKDVLEVGDDEPGLQPFAAAQRNKAEVCIALNMPAFRQEWTGEMPDLRLSHGFINVMKPDFHLHLKAGHVASWQETCDGNDVAFYAIDKAGARTGLVISGKKEDFQ